MVERGPAFVRKLFGYSLALIGPVVSAGAQFVLSLVLLRRLDTSAFGGFSFLLIAAQFSWGVWSALFCAPLPIILASGDRRTCETTVRSIMATNLACAALAFVVFLFLAVGVGLTTQAALLFAGFAAMALLRWFARAHAYATNAPLRTTASDVLYTVILLVGIAFGRSLHVTPLNVACGALCASASIAMLPFGTQFLADQFRDVSLTSIPGYVAVWRRHAGWSLVGVLTTEATVNAHVYIVTAVAGPAAFAPLAASALMLRPITVAMNALTEFERAQIARAIAHRQFDHAMLSVRFFRLILLAAWLATVVATATLLRLAPRAVFPAQYELRVLAIGAALWCAVTVVRVVRTPESVLLQAAGEFRPLAMASVISSLGSVAGVFVLLKFGGPLASIAGVLVGELLAVGAIRRVARRWQDTIPRGTALAVVR